MVKKLLAVLNPFSAFVLMAMMNSCSYEEEIFCEPEQEETGVWHSAKVKFNISRTVFDHGSDGTRATDEGWKDGDVVYLLLTDKDGNKVQAYVQYDGSSGNWSDVMYEGLKSYLTCTSERKVEAYFMEGVKGLQGDSFVLSNGKAVYACTDGVYIFPADNDMTISISLMPLTGRIRLEGKIGTTIAIGGLKTYTSFSRATGQFVTSVENISTMVGDNGSTPYIYSVFADETSPTLFVTSDATYKTVFDASSTVLKPGKSGFLTIPTSTAHREWVLPVLKITIDKSFLSLEKGERVQLQAVVYPENATDKSVIWTSSDTSVADVDKNGMVSAISYGTATITASSVSDSNVKVTRFVVIGEGSIEFSAKGISFKMMHVEAGTFQMGSTVFSDEQPIHSVTITKDYFIGETEVTQALWYAVMGYKPTSSGSQWSSSYGLGDNYPAYYISYEDVQEFLVKLNILAGQKFRMPTEAEWEFAARGGNKSKGYIYSGSNTIDDVAWYSSNKTHPVKTKAANELDIYDMGGNVWEWCSDWYGDYSSSAQTDPTGPATGSNRVKRGGSWGDYATYCRCANRRFNGILSDQSNYLVGFRLAL